MRLAVLLLLVVLSSPVLADPVEIQLHYISPGEKCVDLQGAEARCYDLEGYKGLLKVDQELWFAKQKLVDLDAIATKQAQMLNEQKLVIETLRSDKQIYGERSQRLQTQLEACRLAREEFPWEGALLGALAGVVVGALATLAVVWAVSPAG